MKPILLTILLFLGGVQSLIAQCGDVTPNFSVSQSLFCGAGPHAVSITQLSTGADAASTNYDWQVNGVTYATTTGLTNPPAAPISGTGNFTISVVSTNGPPFCNQNFSLEVQSVPQPVASFSFLPGGTSCAGIPLSFTNTSTGTIAGTTYTWNFGDGQTATGPNPSHTYLFGGTYTVTLTVSNAAGCTSTATQTVNALEIPNVFATGDDGDGNTTNCLLPGDPTTSQTVDFSNFTTGAVSYHWDFGDGTTSTAENPSHLYTSYGTYNVVLTATGPNGCTASQTIPVVFERFVSASLTLDITEYSGCLPHPLTTLQNLSVNATQFVWNFGDGTPPIVTNSAVPPSHIYNTPGNYTISLSASNSCNSANATISPIVIVGPPVANFTPSVTTGCAPQGVSFTNTSTGASPANNYQWNMGNGNVYNNVVNPPAQNYVNQGTYNIALTANNACGSHTQTIAVVIDSIPVAQILSDPLEGCSPLTVSTQNLSTGTILNHFWYLNGVLQTTANTFPTLTFTYPPGNSPVTNTISLTVSNQCGSSSDSETIIVHRPTLAQFAASATTICAGGSINFTNSSLGEDLTYSWDFANGETSANQSPGAVSYPDPGTYTVQLLVNGYCGPDMMELPITVNPITQALVNPLTPLEGCSPVTVEFENVSTGVGLSYTWMVDGVVVANTPNLPAQTFTELPGNAPVNHTISLTVTSACGTETVSFDVLVHRPTEANMQVNQLVVCEGSSFVLTDQSLGENLTWFWDFGDGTSSTDQGPHTLLYSTPGDYTVTLDVLGFCGPDQVNVVLSVLPEVDIQLSTLDPLEGCSPMTVQPVNSSSGVGLTYQWFLNGTLFSTDEVPAALDFVIAPGNTPDTNWVVLQVNSACGTELDSFSVVVHRPNLADFVVAPLEVCLGDEITVTDLSLGENLAWFYEFGDGTDATDAGPHVLNYAASGTYVIQLVLSGYCPNDTLEQVVQVYDYPVAAIQSDILDGCQPLVADFSSSSSGGTTFSWNFGAASIPVSSAQENPGSVTFPNEGVVMVVLEVETNGCADNDTLYLEVFPLPEIAFFATPVGGCNPLTVEIVNTSADNGTEQFTWDLGNNTTFSGYSPPDQVYVAATADSTYTIQLTVTNGVGCVDSLATQVTVNPLPVADFVFADSEICLSEQLGVLNQSLGATTYSWDFGDGQTAMGFEPVHHYVLPGTYTVTLTVATSFGCTDSYAAEVIVRPVPHVDFTASTECFGFATEFTNASSPDVVSWSYSFGDGVQSSDENPVHVYPAATTYTATLMVENQFGCSASVSHPVLVNTVPITDFTAANFCWGEATQFQDLSTGTIIDWQWDFGDGSLPVNGTQPQHTFPAVGSYEVQLITFGGSGCSDTVVQTITITEVPVSDFAFFSVCTGDTTVFVDLTTGNPDVYLWDFGDGTTATVINPTHVYVNPGTYTVSLTTAYAVSGCVHTFSAQVEAFPRTTPDFSFNIPCLGAETVFVDQSAGFPVAWTWDFGNGTQSNLSNPSVTYSNPGFYDVSVVTTNVFGCADTVQQTVEVFPLPVAGFEFDTVCLNAATSFIDVSTDAVHWQYQMGDGQAVNGIGSPTYLYAVDGTYAVTQVVTNAVGCTDTLVRDVIVRPNPLADFSADTACYSYWTNFTDLSTDAVSWTWQFNDNNAFSNTQQPSYVFTADGLFQVELVVENQFGCTDSLTRIVLVLPQPVAAFVNTSVCAGSEVAFTNTSSGSPILFNWNFGDGTPEVTAEHPTHTYYVGGNYTITYSVENTAGCADTLNQVIEVFTVPQIAFTADTVCLFGITSFTNLTQDSAPIAQWYWQFGDGNSSFQQNPTYIYQNPGVYDVILQVTNSNGCDSTIIQPVHVSPIPDAAFDANVVCLGSPTTFTDLSTGNPTQWIWNFGDGTVVNGGPVEQHTYQNPGNYVVTLLVSGGSGACNDQTFQIITVDQEATAGMILPAGVCMNGSFAFTDNSTSNGGTIATYEWNMGDGTVYNSGNGTHSYLLPGTYTVTLTVTSADGCVNSTSQQIVVYDVPTPDFTATLACQGQSVQFITQGPGLDAAWNWNFGDGNLGTGFSAQHTYANAGNYTVILTVTNQDGCQGSSTQSLSVHPTPTAAFVSNTVCWGTPTSFTDLSTISSGSIVAWNWDFGSTIPNPQYTHTDYVSQFDATLEVTSDLGCSATVTNPVNFHPIVNFAFTPNQIAGCAALEVQFTDNSVTSGNAQIVGWIWDFGDGTFSFAQNPVHVYPDAGTYPVQLTVTTSTDCQFTQPLPTVITVYPKPVAGFSTNPVTASIAFPHIQISDESQGAVNWEYAFGDGYYSNLSSPLHTYNEVGVFTIMQIVYSDFGCADTAYRTVRIDEYFTFFVPNSFTPNGDGMNDSFQWAVMGVKDFEMRIFNRWGELIYRTFDPQGYWDGSYNGEFVQDGVYIWQATMHDLNGEYYRETGHVTVLR
jgi:gliding motility-associated-like protein